MCFQSQTLIDVAGEVSSRSVLLDVLDTRSSRNYLVLDELYQFRMPDSSENAFHPERNDADRKEKMVYRSSFVQL